MSRQKNFLFIITDQQRADHLGCYGNPVLKTPNIDSIAAKGTRFDRFYVATPICMPNRSTLMTGRMPSKHGVRSNGIPLPVESVTFVDLLRAAGYRTGLIGKSHLQNMTELTPLMQTDPGNRETVAGLREARYPSPVGDDRQELPQRWRDPDYRVRTPYYGFDTVELCDGHGDLAHGDYARWLAQRTPDPAAFQGAKNALPAGEREYVAPQGWRTRLPEELYPTSYIAERAIASIEESAVEGKPFFLKCSFPDPHHPFTPPGHYWDLYDPADVRVPQTCRPPGPDAPPHLQWLYDQRISGQAKRDSTNVIFVTPDEARDATALTFGMIAMIDDAVGRILAALERSGLAEDTVVVFTTDHGDFMGDHGLLFKGPLHYEGLVRVPFIWHDPEVAAKNAVSHALSGTLDIADTILDRAGLAGYNGIQGASLMPIVRGETDPQRRDAVLIEEEGQRTHLGFNQPPSVRTLITERWRMSVYRGVSWGEMYDLDSDPCGSHNLWNDPAYAPARAELTEQLVRKTLDLTESSPLPTRVA
jgi:arylsulfatase A-like enzyme